MRRIKKGEGEKTPGIFNPKLVGAGAVAGSALWAALVGSFLWRSTHPKRRPVRLPSDSFNLPIENVSFSSRGGMVLKGWFLPSKEARGTVIFCHGYPSSRGTMLPFARQLNDIGFHSLLFDFRAMGESGGDVSTIGYLEIEDLLGAVDYLSARSETSGSKIGVYGFSMGGAVAIMAAAQDDRISAVVTHGAYANLERAIYKRGKLMLGPLGAIPAASLCAISQHHLGFSPSEVSPLAVIGQIAPRPILLFHGQWDQVCDLKDGADLYQAAKHPKRLFVLPRSWHSVIAPSERHEYNAMLKDFFRNHLCQE